MRVRSCLGGQSPGPWLRWEKQEMWMSGVWGSLRRWTQLEPVLGQSYKTKGQGTGGGHRTEIHQARSSDREH